jgi:bifunctional DNA-binding transcriptional regulator/antitoxin component of YhaV-PrlF toxin-antitoxin module
MQATLDNAGKILVPEELRKQLGVTPGDPISLRVEDSQLVLSTSSEGKLIREDGLLVWDGGEGTLTAEMVEETMDRLRAERTLQMLGFDR